MCQKLYANIQQSARSNLSLYQCLMRERCSDRHFEIYDENFLSYETHWKNLFGYTPEGRTKNIVYQNTPQ